MILALRPSNNLPRNKATSAVAAAWALGFALNACAPPQPCLWITNQEAGTVSVIDSSTDSVVDTILVGANPAGIAVGKTGRDVFVSIPGPTRSLS